MADFRLAQQASLDHVRRRVSTTQPLPAVFVLEPHMHAAAGLVAAWDPAATLQVLGGVSRPRQPSVRDTLLHAVDGLGARSIVVCLEADAPPADSLATHAVLAACRGLLEDETLAPLLRAHAVELEVLCFDRSEGDIHRWDARARGFKRLTDVGIEQLLRDIAARAGQRLAAFG